MILSLLILFAASIGGFAFTYLFDRDEPFLWRACAGTVIGSCLLGTVAFLLASIFGLSAATAVAALVITLMPGGLLISRETRTRFDRDVARAKGKFQGANSAKALRFAYYAGFIVLFIFFFDRAIIETAEGIATGGSNNLGDLPFHLGAILSFTDGANFPPENPNYAGAKFSYPFIADLVTAVCIKLGAGLRDAMLVQNVAWAFSLLVLLEHFVRRVTGDHFAGKLAPPLLFFSGGLGFLWFFSDYAAQAKGFTEYLNNLPKDYTIGDEFRWGNSMTTLFLTQRSLLLGMPLALMVLGTVWEIVSAKQETGEPSVPLTRYVPFAVVGLVAGMLPLVHLHSLAVLFVVTGFLVLVRRDRWREFAAFGLGVCIVAVPLIAWAMSGSATRASEFVAFHFGFDKRDTSFFWFWIKNTGLFIPLLAAGIYLWSSRRPGVQTELETKKKRPKKSASTITSATPERPRRPLLLFFIPFAILFGVANLVKLAPWEWDNIKVLIYWFVGSLPFVAFVLAGMWRRGAAWRVLAGLSFVVLTASGALDVWRTVSRAIDYRVFDADAVSIANRIRAATPSKALILNAPTYNTAVVLSGRRSLMRYPGHLSSHGIDYQQREEDVKAMYRGGAVAEGLIESYGVEYVLISPEERHSMGPNEAFFVRYPIVAQAGQYRLHKVTQR